VPISRPRARLRIVDPSASLAPAWRSSIYLQASPPAQCLSNPSAGLTVSLALVCQSAGLTASLKLPDEPTPAATLNNCNTYVPNDSVFDRLVWVTDFFTRNGIYVFLDNHLREDQTALTNYTKWIEVGLLA
jgi:hypothetical protein